MPALAWATAQESYGYYYTGDVPGAVASARQAQDTARVPCVGTVTAAALEMRARARATGDASAAMAALAAAVRIRRTRLSGDDLAASAFGYAESRLVCHSGDALTCLGDTSAAIPALNRPLELCSPGAHADWAMIRLNRAECLTIRGRGSRRGPDLRGGDRRRTGRAEAAGDNHRAGTRPARQASPQASTHPRPAVSSTALVQSTTGMKEIPA